MAKALVLFQISVLLLSSFAVLSNGQTTNDKLTRIKPWSSLNKNEDHLLPPAQAPKPHHKGHRHPKHAPSPSPIYTHPPPPPKAKPPTAAPPPPKSKPPTPPPPPPKAKPPTPPPPPPYYPKGNPVAVRGLVYCKPCKNRGVETLDQATPLKGAVVKLLCNNTKKTLVAQGTTDKNGFFLIMPKALSSKAYHKCKAFLVSSNNTYCDVPTNYNSGKSGALLKYTPVNKLPFGVFTVGPFGFEPSKKVPCKK